MRKPDFLTKKFTWTHRKPNSDLSFFFRRKLNNIGEKKPTAELFSHGSTLNLVQRKNVLRKVCTFGSYSKDIKDIQKHNFYLKVNILIKPVSKIAYITLLT